MGWFGSSSSNDGEAIRNLDPKLKEFLESEKPAPNHAPTSTPSPPLPPPPAPKPVETPKSKNPIVPPESQFQDGRYAHIWKNYVPQAVVDQRGKTDQEKLSDIVDAYNDRRSQVGRTALENCAFEYMSLHECYRHGSITDRLTSCRKQIRSLDRCYSMQQKFLQALGYMSVLDRSPEEEERIQMHADKLYHQMLEREELMEKAKKEGKPIPDFAPMFSPKNINAAMSGKEIPLNTEGTVTENQKPAIWNELTPKAQAELEERIKDKTGFARDLEIQTINAEIEANRELGKEVGKVFEEEQRNRALRREAGRETLGDTLKRWWGWK